MAETVGSARAKLENLTDAIVEDILRAPDEDVLLEALGDRFEKLREERDFLKAQLAGERKNIAGWIAARDANLARAEEAERKVAALREPTKPMLAAGAQALVNAQAHNGVAQLAVLPAYEVWNAMVAALLAAKDTE